jgi:hypothetical protein
VNGSEFVTARGCKTLDRQQIVPICRLVSIKEAHRKDICAVSESPGFDDIAGIVRLLILEHPLYCVVELNPSRIRQEQEERRIGLKLLYEFAGIMRAALHDSDEGEPGMMVGGLEGGE